jgi:hypothetical protein
MEQVESGSAARELATPETATQQDREKKKRDDAPEAKEFETETDEKLPEDQQAMQPDSS